GRIEFGGLSQLEPVNGAGNVALDLVAEREPAEYRAVAGIKRDVKGPLTIGEQERFLRGFRAICQHARKTEAASGSDGYRSVAVTVGLHVASISAGNQHGVMGGVGSGVGHWAQGVQFSRPRGLWKCFDNRLRLRLKMLGYRPGINGAEHTGDAAPPEVKPQLHRHRK